MKTSHNFAVFALAAVLVSTASAGFAAGQPASVQGDENPLADRAATLGGTPFTVSHGADVRGVVTDVQVSNENPLADRAATLEGNAFTVESAEGSRYHNVRVTNADADRAAGNPLAERAATLDGKAFTVEHAAPAPAFLAHFQ